MEVNKSWEPEFTERLEKHYDEMKWLYGEIYHNDQQAFDYLLKMLHEYYAARSPLLKEWDRIRMADPDWVKGNKVLGMLMYTNCFAGNLQGVISHLDYIQECGVNYLHLMPLLESPKDRGDGGYAVSNFRKVQPELGTMEDLAELGTECHSRGMSICLDFVMNHTSEDHPWAKRARAGEKEYQDRYFFYDDWTIPNEFEKTVPQVFPTTAPGNFTWCEEAGKVVMTQFYPYQWDLNYANPVVFNDMTADMLNLCNHGVDIVRLDATPYIWKELGTNCRNLPKVHTLVRLMRMCAEIVCPGTMLLGEIVMEPKEVVPYFGTLDKPECHMIYNVTTMASIWHTVATKDVRLLRHQLDTVYELPSDYTFLNYLRCHDDIGWGLDYKYLRQFGVEEVAHKKFLNDWFRGMGGYDSDARGELYNDDPRLGDARLCGTTASLCGIEAAEYEKNDWKLERSIKLDLMLHALMLCQSGIPVLYSGDEIGQKNDYGYHLDPIKCEDSRYIHRGDFDWEEAEKRHDPETREGKIFQGLLKLEELRRKYGVFEAEARAWTIDTGNNHILGIGRYNKGMKFIGLFNFSENRQTAWINEVEDYVNVVTGKTGLAKDYVLEPFEFAWLITEYGYAPSDRQVPRLDRNALEAKKAEEAPGKTRTRKAAAPKAVVKPAGEKKPAAGKKPGKTSSRKKAAPAEEKSAE
jgi:amylosucrase